MITLLVVDDEFDAVTVLEMLLSLEGYRVITARDGHDALEKLANEIPDLIITDWMMPRMDGVELCRQVRRNPATASIPIILTSAARVVEPADAPRPYDAALQKPIELVALLETIRRLLGPR